MRPLYLLFPVYDVLSPSHKGVFEGFMCFVIISKIRVRGGWHVLIPQTH